MINWPEVVEGKIREARDKGLFDDLAGKGRPLNLSTNPSVKPEWETAYRILKTSGFAPEWIQLHRGTRKELE